MQSTEGSVQFHGYRTWYRITGDLRSDACPLIVLHGGPGCTHDYVDSFKDLAANGRAVIHYDQLGNGKSTHLPDADPGFWTVGLFLDELQALITQLGLSQYALLGQSWGGMLAAEHAVRRPAGLRALVIANSPASMGLWRAAALRLRARLPEDIQAVLDAHEAAGTLDAPAYRAASQVFYAQHVCRVLPWPADVARTFAAIDADPTVYHAMNGPTEFHVVGSLRNWSIIERLHRISVPTLVLSGKYDEATPETVEPYARLIPDARWHVFANSSHMPHVEERPACMRLVGNFLDDHTPWPGAELAHASTLAQPRGVSRWGGARESARSRACQACRALLRCVSMQPALRPAHRKRRCGNVLRVVVLGHADAPQRRVATSTHPLLITTLRSDIPSGTTWSR